MEFHEQLQKLIRNKEVRKEVVELVSELDVAFMLDGAVNYDLSTEFDFGNPRDFMKLCTRGMQRIFVNQFAQPSPVLAKELALPFIVATGDEEEEESPDARWYEPNMEEFVRRVGPLRIEFRRSSVLQIGTGLFTAVHEGELSNAFEPITLFESESGFIIRLIAVLPASAEARLAHRHWLNTACIQVEGEFSPTAFDLVVREVCSVFSTLLTSGTVLAQMGSPYYSPTSAREEDLRAEQSNFEIDPLRDADETADQFDNVEIESNEIDELPHPPDPLAPMELYLLTTGPLVCDGKLGPWYNFIPDCLEAYYTSPELKDSIPRRLSTAVRLLTQADMQAGHGVGLALSVAAVEAMLCRKGSDLANTFAENAVTLLEPDPHYRAQAVQWCKRLYGLRSDVFHGNQVDTPREEFENARLLAAAVLKAMVERRNFLRGYGLPADSPDELINEMARDKYTPGQLTGVADSPVVAIWRSSQ